MPVFDLGGGVAAAPPQTPNSRLQHPEKGGLEVWWVSVGAASTWRGAPYFPWGSVHKCLYLVDH